MVLPLAIANNLPSPLPTPATATSNFSDGMACAVSGYYAGTFSGTDTGPWVVVMDPTDNKLAGAGASTNAQSIFFLSGTFAPTVENNILLGVVSTGASYTGAV